MRPETHSCLGLPVHHLREMPQGKSNLHIRKEGRHSRGTPTQAISSGELPEAKSFDSFRISYSSEDDQERSSKPSRR